MCEWSRQAHLAITGLTELEQWEILSYLISKENIIPLCSIINAWVSHESKHQKHTSKEFIHIGGRVREKTGSLVMFKLSLINIYFLTVGILPGMSVFIYLCIPVQTVKVFGGDTSAQSTRDAAQLWVRTTSNGDILVSLLHWIALFRPSDWFFRQTVIRVCSISNFVHFTCFLCHHYFVQPHHLALVIVYYSAIFLTLLSGLGWGLNWDRILKGKSNQSSPVQFHNSVTSPFTVVSSN